MNCPDCGSKVRMTSPNYGSGAEYVCYKCSVYGARFVDDSAESRAESAASRAASAANAEKWKGPA